MPWSRLVRHHFHFTPSAHWINDVSGTTSITFKVWMRGIRSSKSSLSIFPWPSFSTRLDSHFLFCSLHCQTWEISLQCPCCGRFSRSLTLSCIWCWCLFKQEKQKKKLKLLTVTKITVFLSLLMILKSLFQGILDRLGLDWFSCSPLYQKMENGFYNTW